MTIGVKVLGEGQLSATKAPLYTVPPGTKAYVKFISALNTSSSPQTVYFFVKPSTVSRQIAKIELEPGGSARIVDKDEAITMDAGSIEGYATQENTVDFLITGAEEV